MTDDELKALVASLAVDSKSLHEAQRENQWGHENQWGQTRLIWIY